MSLEKQKEIAAMREKIRTLIDEVDTLEGIGKSLYAEPTIAMQFEKAMAWYGWAKHGNEYHDGRGGLFFVEMDQFTKMLFHVYGISLMQYC